MAQKRATKTGKIRWIGRYRDHGGKERSKSFDTKREAVAWEAEQRRAVRRGEWVDPADEKTTVGDIFTQWINRPLKPRTRELYEYTLAEMVPIVDVPARQLMRSQVDGWYQQMTTGRPWRGTGDEGVSAKTARRNVSLLSSAFEMAMDDGLVVRNPVRIPKVPPGGSAVMLSDIPTVDEVVAVAQAAEEGGVPFTTEKGEESVTNPHPVLAAMIRTAAASGLRVGELCGLVVGDVDFLRRQINVEAQLSKSGTRRVPPKTASSVRQVPVAADLLDVLDGMCAGKAKDGPVFVSAQGAAMSVGNASHAMRRVSRGSLSFHRLRHFYASALIASGVPVTGVQAALGHASASLTLTTYTHLWGNEDDRTRQAIAGVLGCGIGAGSESGEGVV